MRKPARLVLAAVPLASLVACQRTSGALEGETLRRAASPLPVAAAAAAGPAATAAEPATPESKHPDWPQPSDLTYGVYLNGSKVGWMRTTTTTTDHVETATEVHVSVGGMGQVADTAIEEHRTYAPGGELAEVSFSQRAATGVVTVHGRREGDELVVDVTAGNVTQRQRHRSHESVRDLAAVEKLARAGKVGATATSERFDPSLQKTTRTDSKVLAAETRMLAGVPTRTLRIESTEDGLGVSETSWLDDTGKVLETQMGGFFEARLEPPDVAKKLDFHQDLLAAAVVKTPEPLSDPEERDHLTVTFTGFGDALPPASPRQKVDRRGDEVVLGLTRDPAPPRIDLAWLDVPKDVAAETRPTPFIQSDAPAIRAAAREAAAGAKTLPDIVEALTHYVFRQVRDEYVPAYSNALEVLQTKRGDCTEHSVLFVALARALGIPARVAVGIAYWPPGGGFGWHAWAEVWAEGRWYAVDPTWNQPIADATHVKLAGGGPAEQARIVMLLGRLKVVALRG